MNPFQCFIFIYKTLLRLYNVITERYHKFPWFPYIPMKTWNTKMDLHDMSKTLCDKSQKITWYLGSFYNCQEHPMDTHMYTKHVIYIYIYIHIYIYIWIYITWIDSLNFPPRKAAFRNRHSPGICGAGGGPAWQSSIDAFKDENTGGNSIGILWKNYVYIV